MNINGIISALGVPEGAQVEVAIVLVKCMCLILCIGVWNFFKIAFFKRG